ncbi:ubiquitin carboxyl-terminal hydrolase 7 isoform X1 [Brachionus plicatilis]|uniref:Ubiquitin carboxyl-terminal hydrolase 7 isoform X1 n=1 Tax=Brachionus plicatilis TaxID=10195 RepID=A0A3M7T7G7_BRAPC|nr:ubiquitin carboxyl-terminal hydrolase 7 isoform X1 [Brachionus plicatilis]
MNDVSIILPCGFSVKYKEILYKSDKMQCPACKTHDITRQEFLNMARNKLVLIEKSFELKKKQYDELMKGFKKYQNDQKYCIDESHDSLKREVDLRREEIKFILNKKIDDYYDGLLEKIDMERDLRLKEFDERIQKADKLNTATCDVAKNLDIHFQFDLHKFNKRKIINAISFVQNIKDDFQEPKFKLFNINDDIDIKKIFGELYSKEETIFILNEDEFDDESHFGATIKLKINNFSLFKDRKSYRIRSKNFTVQKLEWYISIELNEKDGEMGFYLHCNSMEKSNEFSVNVTAELSLLNKSDSKKNFSLKFGHLFTQNDLSKGYSKFTSMDKITDPANGFYDANDDSITLKAVLKTNSSQKSFLSFIFFSN